MGKIARIFGISRQDGSYLAELLIKKKCKVCGILNPKKKNYLTNFKSLVHEMAEHDLNN